MDGAQCVCGCVIGDECVGVCLCECLLLAGWINLHEVRSLKYSTLAGTLNLVARAVVPAKLTEQVGFPIQHLGEYVTK